MISLAAYALWRFVLRPHGIQNNFTIAYLNDFLCLPLFLPISLYIQRCLRIRHHDAPPRLWEILQHWIIFSVLFEAILPCFPAQFHTTADPYDVLAYLAGGMTAAVCWR